MCPGTEKSTLLSTLQLYPGTEKSTCGVLSTIQTKCTLGQESQHCYQHCEYILVQAKDNTAINFANQVYPRTYSSGNFHVNKGYHCYQHCCKCTIVQDRKRKVNTANNIANAPCCSPAISIVIASWYRKFNTAFNIASVSLYRKGNTAINIVSVSCYRKVNTAINISSVPWYRKVNIAINIARVP